MIRSTELSSLPARGVEVSRSSNGEKQRGQLLEMIGSITFNVTAETIEQTKDVLDGLLGAIRKAEIEESVEPEESDGQ